MEKDECEVHRQKVKLLSPQNVSVSTSPLLVTVPDGDRNDTQQNLSPKSLRNPLHRKLSDLPKELSMHVEDEKQKGQNGLDKTVGIDPDKKVPIEMKDVNLSNAEPSQSSSESKRKKEISPMAIFEPEINELENGLLQNKTDGYDSELEGIHGNLDDDHQGRKPHDGTGPTDDLNDPTGQRYGGMMGPTISPILELMPNVNTYQQKKNLAQGMMDLALLSANASQLRYILESTDAHPYYYTSIIFISISILAQVMVGIGLILNSRYDVNDEKEIYKADKINNLTVLGIFLITIVNVFITSFSVATPVDVNVPQPPALGENSTDVI